MTMRIYISEQIFHRFLSLPQRTFRQSYFHTFLTKANETFINRSASGVVDNFMTKKGDSERINSFQAVDSLYFLEQTETIADFRC